jgi:histidine triad (HIT) family protein
LLLEMLSIVRDVARELTEKHGACRVLTNLGKYQDSKHLHWHVNFGEPRKEH